MFKMIIWVENLMGQFITLFQLTNNELMKEKVRKERTYTHSSTVYLRFVVN